jgi:DNA-binding transcriptional LysR family regulator
VLSQFALLREGRLDVGFVRPPVGDPALSSEVLLREPLVIALPRKHRLASRSHVALSALAVSRSFWCRATRYPCSTTR